MITTKQYLQGVYGQLPVLCISLVLLLGCKSDKKEENTESTMEEKSDPVIEIVTQVMDFQSVDTIPSGWNTFRYINKSNEPHFFLLDKYPEGKTIEDTEKEVMPAFNEGMDLINEGKSEEGFAAFNKLPAWFFDVVFTGGSGLVSPRHSSTTTVYLEPGYYIMECYVKMSNGKFHSSMGMAKPIIITEESSKIQPPEATVLLSISSTEGITYDGEIGKGPQTFSVEFIDQIAHENFVGHDINLVRWDENSDLDALDAWMNWADPKGLINPAPEGFTFLGGVNEMPAGSKAYFKADLSPGTYAFVSEVPQPRSKNMLKTFVVSE
ncbi:hypothetical protein OO010_15190 [Flavobacteriaceae bacterium KMM 6898]|nr:hypothetical protein [Flavobacteriaceae bacterium KMM 6898]